MIGVSRRRLRHRGEVGDSVATVEPRTSAPVPYCGPESGGRAGCRPGPRGSAHVGRARSAPSCTAKRIGCAWTNGSTRGHPMNPHRARPRGSQFQAAGRGRHPETAGPAVRDKSEPLRRRASTVTKGSHRGRRQREAHPCSPTARPGVPEVARPGTEDDYVFGPGGQQCCGQLLSCFSCCGPPDW
jgi:hypothetical protein